MLLLQGEQGLTGSIPWGGGNAHRCHLLTLSLKGALRPLALSLGWVRSAPRAELAQGALSPGGDAGLAQSSPRAAPSTACLVQGAGTGTEPLRAQGGRGGGLG